METIVTEILEIIKGAKDSISREERIRSYLEDLACRAVSEALERIDKELAGRYADKGWHVERLDWRTVQASYGTLRIRRRRMCKEGEAGIYPLDKELGIRPYRRYTAYLEYTIAQIAAKTVYRVTADAVNLLTPVTMSHQQVARVVKQVGETYSAWEDLQATPDPMEEKELRQPQVLYIEGDGLMLHGQKKKQKELHRFQIAEGVRENGNRRELIGTHYIADFSHEKAKDRMLHYIGSHYDLTHTLVLSNSDGGAGYSIDAFKEIVGKVGRHEHFRDWYHVQRKCKERLSWANRKLRRELHRALKNHDRERLGLVLDTLESTARDEHQAEQVRLLRGYMTRNWSYLASLEQRGLGGCSKLLGTCESNHRLYSYRMKKQGRRWSGDGGKAMAKIITGLKNGDLREAMVAKVELFNPKSGRDFRGAVRQALKKSKGNAHEGVRHGRITVSAPMSSAIGHLSKCFA